MWWWIKPTLVFSLAQAEQLCVSADVPLNPAFSCCGVQMNPEPEPNQIRKWNCLSGNEYDFFTYGPLDIFME